MASGTAPGDVQFTYAQLEGLWIQAAGSRQTAPMAAAVAMAESGGNSTAYDQDTNGSIDRGLWQINSVHGAQSTYDVMGNARAAVALSNNGTTWQPWVAYNNGSYRGFLRSGVAPDMNVPINATNAAANQGSTSATFVSQNCWNPLNWLSCAGSAATGATESVASGIIGVIVDNILNPLITLVAGVIGMSAGISMMVVGIMFIVMGSETGRKGVGTGIGLAGLAAGQPEVAAVGAGVAGSGVGSGAQAGIRARRTTLVRQQAGSEVAARQSAQQQRILYRTTVAEQIKGQSRAYAQYQRGEQSAARQAAQASLQAARTEHQRQAHRQKMSRATQRARLADRPRPKKK